MNVLRLGRPVVCARVEHPNNPNSTDPGADPRLALVASLGIGKSSPCTPPPPLCPRGRVPGEGNRVGHPSTVATGTGGGGGR